jgi:hypothetical protein
MNNKFTSVLEKYLKENNPNVASQIEDLKRKAAGAPKQVQDVLKVTVGGMSSALSKNDPKTLDIIQSITGKLGKPDATYSADELKFMETSGFLQNTNKEQPQEETEEEEKPQQQTSIQKQQQPVQSSQNSITSEQII